MPRFSDFLRRHCCVVLGLALLSCSESSGAEEGSLMETVLTIELPAAELEEAWTYMSPGTFEYRVYLDDTLGEDEPRVGTFALVGRGAANYATAGEPTEVLRAWVDLPSGLHGVNVVMRDEDGEIILTFDGSRLPVARGEPTEWYHLFDPRTFDPLPVNRSIELTVETPTVPGDFELDRIEYSITCGFALTDDVFLSVDAKRFIACGSESKGVLVQVGESSAGLATESVATTLWRGHHDESCGACAVTVTALDAEGTAVCHADLELELQTWSFSEQPSEQVFIALPCAGALP